MKILVAGAGQIGNTLASVLIAEKYDVVLVENESDTAKDIANETTALVIHGDAGSMDIMKQAGIKDCEIVIACTGDDKTNIMACEIAKDAGVKQIVSRVNNVGNEELFTRLGAVAVSSVSSIVSAIKRNISSLTDEKTILTLGKGEVQVLIMSVGEESKIVGLKIADIQSAIIGTIYRKGDLIFPKESTVIEKGDSVIITVKTKDLLQVKKLFSGK
ncbi:TrkA family potassium uptake protein [Candidatus Woesearchaeota archaeon]|jgi:trk system potassium uptake protein|nr:TrkA family potassium uptake protein [Candidatus Woesearchaeota archaeon]MBT6519339.1 TrkA family potassium uptake protein [Candidatus Woesearchaeota archaeon]MBT7366799.1 TrkA family potassium uptake protein [Candidatus Woesearchaeota archaeon]